LCSNNATIRRQRAERAVLSGLTAVLSSPEFIQEIVAEIREMRRLKHAKTKDTSARIGDLTERRDNLVEAIATKGLSASPGLARGLERAEEELARLKAEQLRPTMCEANVMRLQADLPIRTVRAIDSLEERLKRGDIPVAREELKHHVGTVTIDADDARCGSTAKA